MSTLVLDRRDLHVSVVSGRLRLRPSDGPPRDVPIRLLERVLVVARMQIDTAVLVALAEAGVTTVILGARRAHRFALVHGRPHNDLAARVAQVERAADESWCLAWAQGVVRRKLRAQRRFAAAVLQQRPDLRRAATSCMQALRVLGERVAGVGDIAALRGLEGAGSRASFALLAAAVPDALGFSGRRRRPPPDPVNSLLSLSYTLLHADAVRAAYVAGLDPYVGFYHRPSFGRESLACDLVEPLRPRVDRWVWRLVAERRLTAEDFQRDRGACLLAKTGRERYFPMFEMFVRPLRRALRRSAGHIARLLRGRVELEIGDEDPYDDEY